MGAKVIVILPNRFKHGYGLSKVLVDEAREKGGDVIITVDNGIVAFEAVDYAKSLGMPVIVTDHHAVSLDGKLPNADLIINPQLHEDNIKASNICGAFVAFLLARDCIRAVKGSENLIKACAELAGIGTIADVMPLEEENWKIVRYLISNFHQGIQYNIGLKLLSQQMFQSLETSSAEDLAFSVIPALNATGRMEDATLGFDLLTKTDPKELIPLVLKVSLLNDYRKKYSRKYTDILSKSVDANDKINVLLLRKTNFDNEETVLNVEGLIGIIASSITEETEKATFVFTENENGDLVGSGRSFGALDLNNLVQTAIKNKEIKVLKAGGHAGAMGLTIASKEFNNFKKVLNSKEIIYDDGNAFEKIIKIPPFFKLEEIRQILRRYEPFGEGFRKPIFMIDATPTSVFCINGIHSQVGFTIGGEQEKGMFFFNNSVKKKPMTIKFEFGVDYLNIKDIEYKPEPEGEEDTEESDEE
jgi:single-stranded-DNA-specific exonuclease